MLNEQGKECCHVCSEAFEDARGHPKPHIDVGGVWVCLPCAREISRLYRAWLVQWIGSASRGLARVTRRWAN